MTFEEAFDLVIGHEGGYVNHPDDPGGETKYGISKRSYPKEDIANLTLERARAIYREDFWEACGCDRLPHPVDFQVFDAAVNSGCRRASEWLQQAVSAKQDGKIGPETLAAVRGMNPYAVSAAFLGRRLAFMTRLSTWPSFGRGWARRIAHNLEVR